MYRFDNPALPTLQPWVNTTRPPATRFVAKRNPYFHRVDGQGQQLPYIDEVVMRVSDGKLIPAKARHRREIYHAGRPTMQRCSRFPRR